MQEEGDVYSWAECLWDLLDLKEINMWADFGVLAVV